MAGPAVSIGRLSFKFDKFTFGTDTARQRPTWVQGILSNYQNPGTQSPFAFIPNGDSIYLPDPMEGFDRGHIVLASNSGVADSENIVPMYPCFNQAGGAWRELELRIAGYVKLELDAPTQPRATQMTVEIEYGAQNKVSHRLPGHRQGYQRTGRLSLLQGRGAQPKALHPPAGSRRHDRSGR